MMLATRTLLLLIVFFTPLITYTKNFGYEQSKVLFFIVLISLSSFVWLLTRPNYYRWTGISKAAGLLMIALLITSLTGINPSQSILGTHPYFQGWFLYAEFFLFFIMVSWAKIRLNMWAYILVGSASLVGIVTIRDWFMLNLLNMPIPHYAGRVVSTFGQPNFTGGYLVFCLPFLYLIKFKERWGYLIRLLVLLILTIAILVSESKGSYLSLIFLMFLLLVVSLKEMLRKIVIVSVIAIVTGAVLVSVLLNTGLYQYQIGQSKTKYWYVNYSPEKRQYIWPVVLDHILQKPLTGYGLENLSQIFGSNLKPEIPGSFPTHALDDVKNLNVDRAHNYILDLLVFSGILGLLVWLVLVGLLVKKLIQSPVRAENTTLLLGLFTYLIWIQFQNQSVVHLIYFWLIAGIIDQDDRN